MSETAPHLEAKLEDRYSIERELGRGGMATVYLARDLKHGRQVALKFLRPELVTSLGAERFLREIQTAARLNHPHILALHESGVSDGRPFYVMPYVEGESLRDRLSRSRQLPVEDAVRITRQVASALDYAHRQGVVHRDIKPENILFHENEALVADFGIARALDAVSRERLTATGSAIGTPQYMSPEQASADHQLDGRSDIYSLGCVLYEMLAGDPPFTGSNPVAIFARKATDQAPPLRTVRGTVSQDLERAVMRALARTPADRFATAREFAEALDAVVVGQKRWSASPRLLAVAGIGVVVAVMVGALLTNRGLRSASTPRSFAVLPCRNAATDSGTRHLGELITGDLIAQASKARAFPKVIALPSVARYRGTTRPPSEVGSELGAEALLFCEYHQTGSRERLEGQLVRASDGAVLWTDDVERDLTTSRTPELAAMMVNGIVAALGLYQPRRDEARENGITTPHLKALNLYKEGRYRLSQFQEDAVRRSIVLFRDAIGQDSNFALPYIGLARAYFLLGIGHGSMREREAFPLLKEAAEKALAINEQLSEAHELLGAYELVFAWNWPAAERRIRRAIELDPNSASAHQGYSLHLSVVGRTDEALAQSARSLELSPVDPIIWGDAGVTYFLARRYAEALPFLRKGLDLAPDFFPDHWAIGVVYAEMGQTSRAIDHLRKADSLSGHQANFRGHLAYAYALGGDSISARNIVRELKREASRSTAPGKLASAIAHAYNGLGERDSVFAWLEIAYEQRSSALVFDLVAPPARRLASDARYRDLVRRVALPEQRP